MSFITSRIGEHVLRINTWNPLQSSMDQEFSYIDLSSVNKDEKTISFSDVQSIKSETAPSRARQLVKTNDVLVATVRPNLNGVAVVSESLNGATASTGYCVLRANNITLDSRYLYFWVRTNTFIDEMMKLATGATYPAVSDKIIKDSEIPLPPLAEQRRIAAILDKADAIRRKRQLTIKLAEDFLRSVFSDMFGDPVTNPKCWEIKPLGECCKFQGGCAFKSSDYQAKGIRLVKITNVHFGNISWDDVEFLPESYLSKYSAFSLKNNDLLMAMTRPIIKSLNTVKLVTVTSGDLPSLLNQRVGRFINYEDWLEKDFLEFFIYSDYFKNLVEKFSSSALQPNISSKEIESIQLPLPPRKLQEQFSSIVRDTRRARAKMILSENEATSLFFGLSQKAFSGNL